MLKKLLLTPNDTALLVLRLALGIMILPHGLQKVFGWFGGYGYSGTMEYFTTQAGFPAVLAFLAIMAEFLGGLGLLAGAITRIAAFGIGVNMIVAAVTVHLPNGFFMNWGGNQQGEGIEFFILAAGIALALVKNGGGRWSVDRALTERWAEEREARRVPSGRLAPNQ